MGEEEGKREGASDLLSCPLPGSINMQGPDQAYLLKQLLKQQLFLDIIVPALLSYSSVMELMAFQKFPHRRPMLEKTWEAS